MADTFQWAGFTFPRRIVALPRGSKADRLNAARAGNACGNKQYKTSKEALMAANASMRAHQPDEAARK